VSGRAVRRYITLLASCLSAAACNADAGNARADSTRDSSRTLAVAPASYGGTRFTQDEASALATLSTSKGAEKYRETNVTGAFVLSGVVEAHGAFTADTLIEPTHDQRVCRPFRDVITPRQRSAVGNAIVWIAGITSGKPNDLPRRTSVRLDNCRLEPRVHIIAEGGTVLVGSRDAMESRIRMSEMLGTSKAARAIIPLNDFGQVVPDADVARTAGLLEVSDDRHPWVRGYIAVSPHPYIAVTTASGAFQFTGVPAGTHEIIVYSEALGVMRRKVEVKGDTKVELTYRQ
jgi:hypothetical protein